MGKLSQKIQIDTWNFTDVVTEVGILAQVVTWPALVVTGVYHVSCGNLAAQTVTVFRQSDPLYGLLGCCSDLIKKRLLFGNCRRRLNFAQK